MLPHRYNQFTSEVERPSYTGWRSFKPRFEQSSTPKFFTFTLEDEKLANTCSEEHFHQHYNTHFVLGLIFHCMFIFQLKPLLFVSMNLPRVHIIQWLLDLLNLCWVWANYSVVFKKDEFIELLTFRWCSLTNSSQTVDKHKKNPIFVLLNKVARLTGGHFVRKQLAASYRHAFRQNSITQKANYPLFWTEIAQDELWNNIKKIGSRQLHVAYAPENWTRNVRLKSIANCGSGISKANTFDEGLQVQTNNKKSYNYKENNYTTWMLLALMFVFQSSLFLSRYVSKLQLQQYFRVYNVHKCLRLRRCIMFRCIMFRCIMFRCIMFMATPMFLSVGWLLGTVTQAFATFRADPLSTATFGAHWLQCFVWEFDN